MEPSNIWRIVHQERAALIADLDGLAPDAWATPSLCDQWTVHEVLAHLVEDARTTRTSFLLGLARAGFNFDRANQRGITRQRRDFPADTLEAFRNAHTRTTSAPAPLASRLVEIIVHGEDIRRALGMSHSYPTGATIAAIEYQLATSSSMGGSKERASRVRLVTTDADFAHGNGPVARGSALDLLMALTGREAGLDALVGEGVDMLR